MGQWTQIVNKKLRKAEKHQVQVYLAGPMRGYPEFNFPAFLEAAEQLRAHGYVVHSPAEEELAIGFNPETGEYPEGRSRTIRENMRDDLCWICEFADLVVLLPDWSQSKGATAEVYTAVAIGVPTLSLDKALERETAGV